MNQSIVRINSPAQEDARRVLLYQGHLFGCTACEASLRLIAHARSMIQEAFQSLDPEHAQFAMPVEEYVAILAPLKPQFIHHPETKLIIRAILEQVGCDLEMTYQDVPRLRAVTSDAYLTSGVGYAHHPHRDTWYSAPMTQINWWIPIYPMKSENSMAFHPQYWDRPIKNSSSEFNYYQWNAVGRAGAAQHVKTDTRNQPKALEPVELDPQTRLIPEPGGMVLFSAAQLHSTVPNTSGRTRYSIDFRTTHLTDLERRGGAPNVDSYCTGTSLRDFLRASDFAPMPEKIIEMYDSGPAAPAEALVYRPA
jgi:hypothetical protein